MSGTSLVSPMYPAHRMEFGGTPARKAPTTPTTRLLGGAVTAAPRVSGVLGRDGGGGRIFVLMV